MVEEKEKNIQNNENEIELQAFVSSPSFKHRLHDKYEGKIVTVEFKCNSFLKKATGCLNMVGSDFLELVGRYDKKVKIEIFRPCTNDTIIEKAFKVCIPLDNICSVELKSPCDPCGPCAK